MLNSKTIRTLSADYLVLFTNAVSAREIPEESAECTEAKNSLYAAVVKTGMSPNKVAIFSKALPTYTEAIRAAREATRSLYILAKGRQDISTSIGVINPGLYDVGAFCHRELFDRDDMSYPGSPTATHSALNKLEHDTLEHLRNSVLCRMVDDSVKWAEFAKAISKLREAMFTLRREKSRYSNVLKSVCAEADKTTSKRPTSLPGLFCTTPSGEPLGASSGSFTITS